MREDQIIIKFGAIATETEEIDFIKAKTVKNCACIGLEFHNVGKCFHGITNKPITKGKMRFRGFTHKLYTFKSNEIANRNPNENEKEFQDPHGATTYLHRSSFTFIKYSKDKYIDYL